MVFPAKLLEIDHHPKVLESDRQLEWQRSLTAHEQPEYINPTVDAQSPLAVLPSFAYGYRRH